MASEMQTSLPTTALSSKTKMAKYANKSRSSHSFSVNDCVLLSTKNLSIEDRSGMRKLHLKFCGPFKIIERIYNLSFRLKLSEPIKARRIDDVFYCSLFKPYIPDKCSWDDKPLPSKNIQGVWSRSIFWIKQDAGEATLLGEVERL